MTLVRAEFLRMRSRRLFKWLTILALAGFLLAGVIVFFNSDNSSQAVAVTEIENEGIIENCVAHLEQEEQAGLEHPDAQDPEAFCRASFAAADPAFNFIEIDEVVLGLSIPILALTWLIGASAVGAEWPNRTMTSLLTWEPRRTRVFLVKLLVVFVATVIWVAVLVAILSAILALVAALRGTFDGADSAWVATYVRRVARVAVAGGLAAAFGASLAMIGRNTAAALGAGFAYLAIVESVIRGFKPSWSDWLMADNLGLFLAGPADVNHLEHSQVGAGLVLLGYAAVLASAAIVTFRTREVA